MVAVFAREITDDLTSLVKKLDESIDKNKDEKLSGFVVFLTDDSDALEPKLKDLAEKEKIKNLPLTIYEGTAGPESYKIDDKAALTVLMWKGLDVKVNHAFKKDQVDSKAVDSIVKDVPKILK